MIRLSRVGKRYGRQWALHDVSLTVDRGEVLGILGPNGSGKTTLFKILAGSLRPSTGCAIIAGCDVFRDSQNARANIGYVPENAPLYEWMRVDEFLRTFARLKHVDEARINERLAQLYRQFDLDDVQHRPIKQLSRGYRQRLSVAQAVLHEPPVLLMDEPTNGLDPRQVVEARTVIQQLTAERATLISSHILSEIAELAHRVAFLVAGYLLTVVDISNVADKTAYLETRYLELTKSRGQR